MMPRYHSSIAIILLTSLLTAAGRSDELGIQVPEGFVTSQFATDELAHDIYSMTFDDRGQLLVSGRGYIKILLDEDDDGRAERAQVFAERPRSGSMGMVWDQDRLLCVGDDGVWEFTDQDRDGRADGEPKRLTRLRHPEHGAHAIIKGPDGWFYVLCGNDANVNHSHVTTENSPVQTPRSGALLRFSSDGTKWEVVAHGFRNPYDFAFNDAGHVFTVDADGERDHHLPWYAPTRLFDISEGGHHGWVLQGWTKSWSRPGYFFDSGSRIAQLGRGSPTGLTIYRHTSFPSEYYGSVFSCCWTLGRVYRLPLVEHDGSYNARAEVFLQTKGDVGFAPVDVEVGPEGDLWVAIGGRQSQGGVFRVASLEPAGNRPERGAARDLVRVLSTPQPLSAWARARWLLLADWFRANDFFQAALDQDLSWRQRVRAIEVLTERFGGLQPEWLTRLETVREPHVLARIAWSIGRQPVGPAGVRWLARLTHEKDARVTRAAWEALALQAKSLLENVEDMNWNALAAVENRQVRTAAIRFARRVGSDELWNHVSDSPMTVLAKLRTRIGLQELTSEDCLLAVDAAASVTRPAGRLEALRLVELGLGDVELESRGRTPGYVATDVDRAADVRNEIGPQLVGWLDDRDPRVRAEVARLMAMLQVEATPPVTKAIVDQFDSEEEQTAADVPRTLHFLMVLAQLGPSATVEKAAVNTIATSLLRLHHTMHGLALTPSRNWPLHVGIVFDDLVDRFPALTAAVADHPLLSMPEHGLFILRMPAEHQTRAARALVSRLDADAIWTRDTVKVVALLDDAESFGLLRYQFDEGYYQDEILRILARSPNREDYGRFVASLLSPNPQTCATACRALNEIVSAEDDGICKDAILALRSFCHEQEKDDFSATRQQLVKLLTRLAELRGKPIAGTTSADLPPREGIYKPWFAWWTRHYPQQASQVTSVADEQIDWSRRFEELEWSAGNVRRGQKQFRMRSCQSCHAGGARLGPDLVGITKRFSPHDLFGAILYPNQDVSPAYYTRQIVTASGKVYQGTVLYQSPDGTLLETGLTGPVRIAGEQITIDRPIRRSLMPEGLLRGASDTNIVDLYAYLQTLQK